LWSGIAYVKRRQGNWDESLAALDRAIELDPRSYEFLWNQGESYQILDRYEESERLFDRAISLAPDAADAYNFKAILYLVRDGGGEKMKELLRTVEEASDIRLFIQQLAAVFGKAALFRIDSDYRALLLDLSLDELGPQRSAYYLARTGYYGSNLPAGAHLGVALAGLGRDDQAVRTGRGAAAMMPVERNALEGSAVAEVLAEIYMMVGEHELAIEQLEHVLSTPAYYQSGAQLRADPFWAPLRGNPRFERLLSVN
jgi:tetratricopeptide (TPR) repeat protein